MKLQEFITENKAEIDQCIKNVCPTCDLDDDERELWILNDEGLYNWALSENVEGM